MSLSIKREIINFDKNQIPIIDLILNYFEISSVDEMFLKLNNDEIYKKLYKLGETKEFRNYYQDLIKLIEFEVGHNKFHYQKIPSFRLQRVNEKTVDYHNDVMYGHGEEVLNFWAPLIDTNIFNTLHLSDIDQNQILLEKYENERMSIKQANKLFRDNSNPCLVNYGEIIVFRSNRIHGSEPNYSEQNRLSFDFRILPYKCDPGTKPLDDFYVSNYSSDNKKLEKIPCIFYLHKRNPIMKNCSHYVQGEINRMYANENGLVHHGLGENEIYGKNHYPVIFHFVHEQLITNIVMASILCLPSDDNLRNELLILAKDKKVVFHFSMENTTNKNLSISKIHDYYDYLLKAEKSL